MVTLKQHQFSSISDQNLSYQQFYYGFTACPVIIFSPPEIFSSEGIIAHNTTSFQSSDQKEPLNKEDEILSKVDTAINNVQAQQLHSQKSNPNVKKTLKINNRQKVVLKKSKYTTQNAERNILPNIIHQIFCFIQKEKRSKQVIVQYLQKLDQYDPRKFNIDRFYKYQRLIKDKINNYINIKGLRQLNQFQQHSFQIYSQSEQKSFIHMNRILIKYFLTHEFENIVLTSSRMNSDTRPLHLRIKRRILTDLEQTLSFTHKPKGSAIHYTE